MTDPPPHPTTGPPPRAVAPRRRRRWGRRPCRLVHWMAFTAAVAMTIALPPTLATVLKNPVTHWGPQNSTSYAAAAILAFWTPIFAVIALVGPRGDVRRIARSYGGSAVLAATAAMALMFARAVASAFAQQAWLRVLPPNRGPSGLPFLEILRDLFHPYPGSFFCPIAWRVVAEGAEGTVAAIVAAWSVLALSGKGRRPSGWFDLLCLLIGLAWVLWLLARDLAPASFAS